MGVQIHCEPCTNAFFRLRDGKLRTCGKVGLLYRVPLRFPQSSQLTHGLPSPETVDLQVVGAGTLIVALRTPPPIDPLLLSFQYNYKQIHV
jgi:hypothetical protein